MSTSECPVLDVSFEINNSSSGTTSYQFDPITYQIKCKVYAACNNENLPGPSTITTDPIQSPKNKETQVVYKKLRVDTRPFLNIPIMTKCQNCETIFPTKYQYQRHKCEFTQPCEGEQIKYSCVVCEKEFLNKIGLQRHSQCHENNQVACEFCNKKFVSENRLRIHQENHCKKAGDISKFYRSDITVWKCKFCSEVFSTDDLARGHASNCGDKNDNCDEITEKIRTEILIQCEFCNRTFSEKDALTVHQTKHSTEKNYECVYCDSSFTSYNNAVKHWSDNKCSQNVNIFYLPKLTYCEQCGRMFKSHDLLYNHKLKKKHYVQKLHPVVTKSDSSKKENEKAHLTSLVNEVLTTLKVKAKEDTTNNCEENVAPKKRGRKRKCDKDTSSANLKLKKDGCFKFQCERCGEVYDEIQELDDHRNRNHPSNFDCEECGERLSSAKALLAHNRRVHQSLKPYVCEICGRSYSQTSHLWQHMRFHQGIKPFACPHDGCEARYTIRPDLKDHIRKVHTRERPFKCRVCSKSFLTGSVYYQHRLIHTNDRRYACNMCPKRFFRADALSNHKRIHTDERPYPCSACGRGFRQKGDRNKHMRTQHGVLNGSLYD